MRDCLPRAANAENFGLAYDVLGPVPVPDPNTGECRPNAGKRQRWLDACAALATPVDYGIHFQRWRRSFSPNTRVCVVTTASRLLIGHGNASASDVGLTVHRTWGTPVIPGTALKGLLSGYVDAVYGPDASAPEPTRDDWAAPTWRGFNIEKAPGCWHAAIFGSPSVPHRIEVTVRFSEAVTVDTSGGTPTVGITMGDEQRRVEYVSGSDTMTLTFVYRVTVNDRVAEVDCVADSLECNGGIIRNASGTDSDPGDAATVERMHLVVKHRGLRGGVTFHDALYVPPDGEMEDHCYALDVLTVHQKPYYDTHGAAALPNDWNSPVPVQFLTVKPRVRFLLALEGPPRATALAMKLLLDALSKWGIGAKTSLGYGAMTRDCEKEKQMQREDEEREQQEREAAERVRREAKERERREREAAERKERLAAMSPIEREIQEILDARPDKTVSEIVAIIKKVRENRWTDDTRIKVAQWLEKKMRDNKCWKETSQKRNPARDRDYQRTLLVMSWLNE